MYMQPTNPWPHYALQPPQAIPVQTKSCFVTRSRVEELRDELKAFEDRHRFEITRPTELIKNLTKTISKNQVSVE
jgi:hypothetical protein